MHYSNFKVAVFDFDGTLCIHTSHSYTEADIYRDRMQALCGDGLYPEAFSSNHMQVILSHLYELDVPMVLMSIEPSHVVGAAKIRWIQNHYGINMLNCCLAPSHGDHGKAKVAMLITLADYYQCDRSQVLFIDDSAAALIDAQAAGFTAHSPMALVCDLETPML